MASRNSSGLCLECGLCCNGVIFSHGQLEPEDDAKHLQALGIRPMRNRNPQGVKIKFAQPCTALDGCRCCIYADRPKYCREFECLLLKSVQDGRTGTTAALQVVRQARRRAETVKQLIRKLGDADEHVALSIRFRRTKKRLETSNADEKTAELFRQLSIAVHNLNLLLSKSFYPDSE
jgi:Fe-S-cluster containining protein